MCTVPFLDLNGGRILNLELKQAQESFFHHKNRTLCYANFITSTFIDVFRHSLKTNCETSYKLSFLRNLQYAYLISNVL